MDDHWWHDNDEWRTFVTMFFGVREGGGGREKEKTKKKWWEGEEGGWVGDESMV